MRISVLAGWRARRPGVALARRSHRRAALIVALGVGIASAPAAGAGLVRPRVVGGSPVAAITSFPFQVAVYARQGVFQYAFCGGAIIDPTQIVTAAHCVTDELTGQTVAPGLVTVLAGTAVRSTDPPASPVAASISVAPQYNPQLSPDYDLAVITLSTPLYAGAPRADGSATIAPIALITPALAARIADPNVTPPPSVTVSGWGETTQQAPQSFGGLPPPSGTPTTQLQAAQTHLVADAACAADYMHVGNFPALTPRMICAGETAGGVDACAGDSGGPLVSDVNSSPAPPGDYVLTGLVDLGAGCGAPNLPGIYVRIAAPEITAFITAQAALAGQQLLTPPAVPPPPAPPPPPIPPPPPTPPPPPPTPVTSVTTVVTKPVLIAERGAASLTRSSGRVKHRLIPVVVRCVGAICSGTLTLRTQATVGTASFTIAANSTAVIRVRITTYGQHQLLASRNHLRTSIVLKTAGAEMHKVFTIIA